MKEMKRNDWYDLDKKLSEAEEMLRNTKWDDECYLINHIRSYLRIKRDF